MSSSDRETAQGTRRGGRSTHTHTSVSILITSERRETRERERKSWQTRAISTMPVRVTILENKYAMNRK